MIKGTRTEPDSALRFTADAATVLLSYIDRNLRYVYANRAYEEWYGFPATEICGHTVQELIGDEGTEQLLPYAERALAGEEVSFETEVHYKHAGLRHISARYVPDITPEGVAGFAVLVEDITERKRDESAKKFLADASVELSASLDYEKTLERVAQLAVSEMADWCVVRVVQGEAPGKRIALAHRDPARAKWAQELEQKYPPDPNAENGESLAIRTGQSQLYSVIDPKIIEEAARDAEHLRVLTEAQIHSAMIVPIRAGDETIGTITFISSIPGRYTERDVQIAQDLAARASLAIQNARLYRSAQEEIEERNRAHQRLQQADERFRLIVTSALDAIISINDKSDITLWEGRAEEIFGWSKAEAIGKKLYDLIIPVELREQHKEGLARYMRTRQGKFIGRLIEVPAMRKDGSRFPAELQVSQVGADGGLEFSAFVRDITERQRAETELRESETKYQALAADLEQRVRERTKELEAFSYSVSHDLRAPLRTISSFSQLLLIEQQDRLDEEGKDNLRRIVEAGQRMSKLIDDLLQYARLARVPLAIREVDLSATADWIINDLRQKSPERDVETTIAQGMIVRGDANLLRVALENLIENAWKFTSKVPHARIEVGSIEQNEEQVYFVRDNGAGFNMEYVNKLFKPFERLHGDYEFPGTGIGLVNVQRIIQRHGGRLWPEAELGKGATFYFTLAG